jgi:UDP-GlcNAc:undecaprenyl-phosphate GlcNAc-1-phosphate transferase
LLVKSAIATFILAVLVTAALTPLVRRLALRVGAVDSPGGRKVHARQVPRLGGVAIVIGFFVPLVTLFVLGTSAGRIFFSATHVTAGLIVGALLIVGVGLLDDVRGVSARTKLLVQVAAAAVAFACGMRIDALDLPWVGTFQLGWFALPATVLWVVGIVNAINLIDGLDGLAAGVAFFACLTNFAIASLTGNVFIFLVMASLGGALVGFLFYNFHPARIFMGDCGSMFLGFVLASASLLGAGTQKSPTLIAIVAPILALGLPIADTLLTIARRFLARRSIFVADRGHIHHRLLDMGLTHRRAVLSLYLLSIAFTVLALVVYFGRSWQVGAALFALTVLLVAVVRFVGYFNSSLVAIGQTAADSLVPVLRRSVPPVLQRMMSAHSREQLPAILSEFGEQSGLLAIGILNARIQPLHRWRWESPLVDARTAREAVYAKFDVADGLDSMQLQFFLDNAMGVVGPQTRVLLQLVADAAEGLLSSSRKTMSGETEGMHGKRTTQQGA